MRTYNFGQLLHSKIYTNWTLLETSKVSGFHAATRQVGHLPELGNNTGLKK